MRSSRNFRLSLAVFCDVFHEVGGAGCCKLPARCIIRREHMHQHGTGSVEILAIPESKLCRRALLAMAMIAVAGYLIAFQRADQGTIYYELYKQAYTECWLAAGAQSADCASLPTVRAHLKAHREAYAVGEPFLNLSLALTLAILLSPLLRMLVVKLLPALRLGRPAVLVSETPKAGPPTVQ